MSSKKHWSTDKKKGKYILLFCVVLLAISAIVARGATPDEERAHLETVKQQLHEKRTEYQKITWQEKDLTAELRSIERSIKKYQQELQHQQQVLEKNKQNLKKIEGNLSQLRQKYQTSKTILEKRLRALYKMGELGYLTPLLAMSSYDNIQQQLKYLQHISKSDRQLLQRAGKDIQSIQKEKKALETNKQKILRIQTKIKDKQADITKQQQQKSQLLQRLETQKQQHAAAIKKLEESAAALEKLLKELEGPEKITSSQAAETEPGKVVRFPAEIPIFAKHFRANKGKLIWPVEGRIVTKFGPIRIGDTSTHYNGVDIQAPQGTPVHSVFKGTVKFADRFRDFGKLVIIDHGGNFYTLYARADKLTVKPGDFVETRQVLGRIGNTDSAKGAHLYFEVRANGKPVNPKSWLAKVR